MVPSSYNESSNVRNYPVRMFKITPSGDIKVHDVFPDLNENEETKRENIIICRYCSNTITSRKNIIEINGKHRHIFTNPAGAVFHIGCFTSALGCLIHGEPTFEYTWFPGFTWCYAICSMCHNHMGWYYQSGLNNFYGLILKNLIENT